jgi:3D-(3,5/4)-trihydroxycyclohexane-1,2-dione acylhydrolase (decyclizing)
MLGPIETQPALIRELHDALAELGHIAVTKIPPDTFVQKAAELIRDAKRLIIISGVGTIYSDGCEELRQFCDEFCIPVTETHASKGVLGWNYAWNAGPIGSNGAVCANELAKEADLIIALGSRLTDFTTASRTRFQNPNVRFIGINVTPMDASKLGASPVVADVKRALAELGPVLRNAGFRGTSEEYRAEITRFKTEWDNRVTEIRTPKLDSVAEIEAIGLINEAVGGKTTVVYAAGNMPGDVGHAKRGSRRMPNLRRDCITNTEFSKPHLTLSQSPVVPNFTNVQ